MLWDAAQTLRDQIDPLSFSAPVACVYNPLRYAGALHRAYLQLAGPGPKRVLFVGMNPGPFGMAQTGVPFGEVRAVRDWMGLRGDVVPPPHTHPKRPILGLACTRSEVSGLRLWGLFAARFKTPQAFFQDHFVLNYCPLLFLESSGRNLTPDKLPASELRPVQTFCDAHLRAVLDHVRPEWAIGVGDFAAKRLLAVVPPDSVQVGKILHPSPASPAANRDWAGAATQQLTELGVWSPRHGSVTK